MKSRPNFLFLSETKLLVREFDFVARALGFYSFVGVDRLVDRGGRRGGLAFLWHAEERVDLTSYSQNHIDVVIHDSDGEGEWRFTGVYGWTEDPNKWRTWDLIDRLALGNFLPWLCLGDFNEILFHYEKHGGIPRREVCMEAFKHCLEIHGLVDLGSGRNMFTWSNQKVGSDNIQERLDRAVVTNN
ncbi:hypothetical protein ACS0TY_014851 [Phlomoides rotata]